MRFESRDEYRQWINSQDWYQTIELENGLVTPGKFETQERLRVLSHVDFNGKRVLDVGCNSGQVCFFAKRSGAREVIGIDILEERLHQARILALNEGLDITFDNRSLFDVGELGCFDIVMCIAVLTEIRDFCGAVEALKSVIGDYAFLELGLAKPLFYLSRSKRWVLGRSGIPRHKAVCECDRLKDGKWVLRPSFPVLGAIFGPTYDLHHLGRGVRYDMVEVHRSR